MDYYGGYKIPLYMVYPMQNVYKAEMDYEKDKDRMKELYPKEARKIQQIVEEECDKMEYDGSLMFDEYPDRVMLKKLCDEIYDRVYPMDAAEMETEETRRRRPEMYPPPSHRRRPGMDLVQVLLFDEMFRRRCRHNRCRRWW